MGLPKCNCKVGDTLPDGYTFGAYRDKLGNVQFMFHKMGSGFRDSDTVKLHYMDVKKLRDWLTKVIEHTERK